MHAFELARPGSLDDALKALAGSKDSAPLGGGTDLLNRMKDYVTSPARLVALQGVKGLAGVQGTESTGLTIGAGTKLVDLIDNPTIAKAYPALRDAARSIGSPQIRNMATVGGNLCQRPRCWYFRSGFGLLALQDGKSLVREGDNRFHSVFMTDGNALYVSPSSLACALVALDASLTIAGPQGEREVPIADLYRVPKTSEEGELALAPGELVTRVKLPAASGPNGAYAVLHKQSHDWPLVMACASLPEGGEPRVAIYGVAPIPWRSKGAEAALKGRAISAEVAEAAGKAATEGAKPLSKNAYKVPLIATAVKRAVLAAAGQRYWES